MTGNKSKKIGKHLYSSKDLMYIVKVTVDENLKKEKVKDRYFKNNPEQWIVFLKLLESVLKLTSYVKLMQHRSLLVAQYIDIQDRVNRRIAYIELMLDKIDLKYKKRLGEATKGGNIVAGYETHYREPRPIRTKKTIDEILREKERREEGWSIALGAFKSTLDKKNVVFSKLIGEADEYLLSMMLNLFN